MTRVALLGPLPPFRSGIADQTVRLARAMTALGFSVEILTFRRMYPRLLYPGTQQQAEGAFPSDAGFVWPVLDGLSPFSFRRAADLAASRDPALVIVPWWTAYFSLHTILFARKLMGVSRARRLLYAHNLVDHGAAPLKWRLSRAVFRLFDCCTVQNEALVDQFRSLAPGVPVLSLPHPVQPQKGRVTKQEARQNLGLASTDQVLLFSGLLRKYKGWDLLLSAFREVTARVPNLLLVFAGEPWREARSLPQLARDLPRVRLDLRYLPDEERALWLASCDAVVCPYRHATGSGIAADAIAFERGVIGTSVPGLTEVIKDGINGFLVPPGDAGALAAAMERFARDGPADRWSAAMRQLQENYSPREHARRLLRFAGILHS